MQRATRFTVHPGDVRLSCLEFGGSGTPCLLVHGLAGTAIEWSETACWLTESHRVVSFDQRGHGASDRAPGRYTRAAYVGDVIAVLEALGGRAVVVGQSMGGTNAYLAAAGRPDLVERLVVIEAGTSPDPSAPEAIRRWLEAWPVPFASLATARTYFASIGLSPIWASTLARRADGYRARFEIEDMVASVATDAATDYAEEWSRIRCPTLVVAGSSSSWPKDEARQMARVLPGGSFACVEGAGHDVHLDAPAGFREAVSGFLSRAV